MRYKGGQRKPCCPMLRLREAGKLAAVVHSNGLEDLRKVLAIPSPEGSHGVHYGLAGLAGDADGSDLRAV